MNMMMSDLIYDVALAVAGLPGGELWKVEEVRGARGRSKRVTRFVA
jgi:hypothetical protein